MATEAEIKRFKKKVAQLIADAGKFDDRKVKEILRILEGARRNVAAAVISTDWDTYYIPQLKEAVNRAIDGFKLRFTSEQTGMLRSAWDMGVEVIDSPLQFTGVSMLLPVLPMSTLEILQGYSADLISGLAEDARKKINGEIMQGIMGQKSATETMKAVGRNLKDKSVFSSIASRAEAIVRTESGHVQSAAREARQEQTIAANPDAVWLKKWIASGKAHPRPNHAALNGVTVPVDENFPGGIPYPHAPGLPAAEVVNCG